MSDDNLTLEDCAKMQEAVYRELSRRSTSRFGLLSSSACRSRLLAEDIRRLADLESSDAAVHHA